MPSRDVKTGAKSHPRAARTATLVDALRRAMTLQRAGNLVEAIRCCNAIRVAHPDHFDVIHLSGVINAQLGRFAEADELLNRARRANPQSAEALANHANVLKALGRVDEALEACDQALALKPSLIEALNTRGAVLKQLGRFGESLDSYERALTIKPDFADALNNRGAALIGLQRYDEALLSLNGALAIRPRYADALFNRGIALHHLRQYDSALATFDQVLKIHPAHIEAMNMRGTALSAANRHMEALAIFDQVLAENPKHANALASRGGALKMLGRHDEALASYDRALTLGPGSAALLNNRGVVLKDLKRVADALAAFDGALELKPDFAEAWNNRGVALKELKRTDEAALSFDRALSLRSEYAEALSNRGAARFDLGRPSEALADLDRALALKPEFAGALQHRGAVLANMGRHDDARIDLEHALGLDAELPYAREALLYSRMHCCDWQDYEGARAQVIADVRHGRRSAGPFWFLTISDSPHDQLQCARTWVREVCPQSPMPLWNGEPYRHQRIRLAYLSSDFREHPIAHLMAGLLERHDRSQFHIVGISFGPSMAGAMRTRMRGLFDEFIDVRRHSDLEVASLLRNREIDIAVDLNGFTTHCRTGILAMRPAPIQVNYLGYPGTMGAEYIDYILADELTIPPTEQAFFTENVVYLPDSYQANDGDRRIAEQTPTRAESGLPEAGFVFCCFNANHKITPVVFDVWMRLLRQVENSVLWLLEAHGTASSNLRREAKMRGVEPHRLVFARKVGHAHHLARHRLADLFLDTLPYNAHTTASDALWTGVPIVTCSGTTFAGRVAASLLRAIGISEMITQSLADYEKLAYQMATDARAFAEIRRRLARNRDRLSLFDGDRFRQHIEAAYMRMWERCERGEPPTGFAVPPILLPTAPPSR